MGGPQASANLSAALEAEARTLGAALILLAVPGDGRWWVLAASEPLLSAHPDPVELWGASAEGPDAEWREAGCVPCRPRHATTSGPMTSFSMLAPTASSSSA